MSPRSPEQFEIIRSEKQQHIMEVSLRLFGNQGFHSTSISNIAKEAGISKGLLYNYFESKEALLLQILQQGLDSLFELYTTNTAETFTPDEMRNFIVQSFEMLEQNPDYWRLYFQVLLQSGVMEIFQPQLTKVYKHIISATTSYFHKMGFKNPETEAIMFGAMLDGLSLQYIMSPDDFPLKLIQNQIIERYCNLQN